MRINHVDGSPHTQGTAAAPDEDAPLVLVP
jgi:hypothetical protein